MYLKSIEVQGFKSFAHKMVFEFHNGITGIVGPNGSGKSNVADAVRWVLGEQRVKQLRGGSMQDVIFSGTENRKPLSYAMVAITLDNSDHQLAVDYEEVKVTRKLYRSGESEYLINGSLCRLRDINEMFYDTGIGKEGYSIIGQGQIDRILSGKPEERRELFDEAAGIVKFKRRKSMSLKKLEEEQQNLLRVNDILSELERQLGPLGRQAETAREYLKKKEELKRYDINMFLLESTRLKEQTQELEENLSNVQTELQEASQSYDAMKAEYEAIEEQVDAIDADIETSKNQLNETNLLKQQLEGQIELLKEQIRSANKNDEHYRQRAEVIHGELRLREEQLQALRAEQEEISDRLAAERTRQDRAQEALVEVQSRVATLTAQIDRRQTEVRDILGSRASTTAKIQHYDTMLEQIRVQKSQLSRQLLEADSMTGEYGQKAREYEAQLREISSRIADQAERNRECEEQVAQLQEQITKQSQQLQIGQSAYHREASRLESLKNITERYDGYGGSIRKVMEQKGREKGILGVVADLIKVDKQYEIAIETALGGSIQNIVTQDEETAKHMIAYLKRNKFGRATFLPLTAIRGGQEIARPEALREKGVIGTADRLVQVEPAYERLAQHLLGRTLVVDHIDTGIALARKYRQSLRMVTLEGELLSPGGSMSGGAFKNSSNLLSRRREIEEFERTVRQLQREMETAQAELEKTRASRAALYAQMDTIQQALQKDYVVQNTAKMNLDQMTTLGKQTAERIRQIRQELGRLDQDTEEIAQNQESIQVELETSERLEKELMQEIEGLQTELEEQRAQESAQVKESEENHLSYAALEQRSLFLTENASRIREETDRFQEELAQLDEGQGANSEEIRAKEEQIRDLRETIESSGELFAEINAQIDSARRRREELSSRNREFLGKREELSRHMAELDKEAFRLGSRKEGLEEAAEKQMNYMWEEYELTYNHALQLRDPDLTDLAGMKRQVQRLKNEIRDLGSVNVNAIEDYKSLSERHTFLKGQHDDLVEAAQTLTKIIEELDTAMRRQFTEQFARIAAEFNQVFKELFGGGKGTLELLEDEDVLEAGIGIIAQPPGKKLQNMMQLSGGEKALTAIALLFAIQNLKPSPFCLLDEIEAALDDSNVVRFANYLHKLTKNTQFIVITHRRGTMMAADRLYGITMQEKGVSAQVSVDLLEKELDK